MSLLQSLFADKKQTSQLHTAFSMGMQQAKQHLWEVALPNFLIAVDLAHSYAKAQVMLCICYGHQVDDETIKIHLRHLQKADAKLAEKIASLPGAARVLCLGTTQETETPPYTKVLVEVRDHHKLPSLLDLRLTPSAYLDLITSMVNDETITRVKIKDTKDIVSLPERCCPSLTPKGEAALDVWESTFSIFADNAMALIEQN
ncbi:MAG: hypothetical protein WCG34_09020 [Leptolinea sp.]